MAAKDGHMSTKSSIAYEKDEATGQAFHLYEECFEEGRIYLELTVCSFTTFSSPEGKAQVQVKLPVAWARKLGLVGPDFKSSGA
jgi:hypothetical protein